MPKADFWKQYAERGELYQKHVCFIEKEIKRKEELIRKLLKEIKKLDEIIKINENNLTNTKK